jgi:hypothetical protein
MGSLLGSHLATAPNPPALYFCPRETATYEPATRYERRRDEPGGTDSPEGRTG